METNEIQLRTVLISLATILFIEMAARITTAQGQYNLLTILGLARLLEIISMILLVQVWGKGLSSIGLARSTLFPGLKKGLLWAVCFALTASFAFALLFLAGFNPLVLMKARLPTKESDIVLFFLVGGLVGPTAEEIFFRGLLYGFLRRWGFILTLVLTTLLFVLAHTIVSRTSLPLVAVGGLVFALAYEVEKSLVAPIIIHVLGNQAIFVLSYLIQ